MLKNIYNGFRRSKFRRKKFRYKKQSYNKFTHTKSRTLIKILSIITIIGVIMLFPHFIRNTYRVTVTHKQIVTRGNTDMYLIYTETEDGDIKIFENTNNFLELKFDSEDLYWSLSVNRKYKITAYGFNLPLLSDYQNIVKVKGIVN
jgi:competence protein ComGC